jgi:hypothetical protein
MGHRIALLADEFYLLAGAEPPRYTPDEISSQIENGVGMIADFWQGWPRCATTITASDDTTANTAIQAAASATANASTTATSAVRAATSARTIPKSLAQPRRVVMLTGLLGARVLEPLVARLNKVRGLDLRVIALENSLYGRGVTVSGLLPGADFERGLESAGANGADLVLLPGNALRPHDNRFLDDLLLDDLQTRHPSIRIQAVRGGACDILAAVVHSPHHRNTGT